nr:hypothetical protein [Tanacetum cinerariifolium]
GAQTRNQGDNTENKDKGKSHVVTITRFRDLNEEFEECINNSSNGVNAVGSSVSAAGLNFTNSTNDFSVAVVRNKARLVAQGHTQEEDIDYEEVFAPVARIEAIRLFLAYASFMGFLVYQMDVKSAFLYDAIEEEVYISSTPIEVEKPLLKDSDGEDVDVHTYRSMIGSLMYLTSSRPDIMFAVCACVRFQVTPKVSHLNAVK